MMVEINKEMKQLAEKFSDNIIDNLPHSDNNYTKLSVENRFYYGLLGEFAFLKYCELNKIDVDYNLEITGRADAEDFKLYSKAGKPITIDVKTATKANHQYIMMPEAQANKYKYDYYVGVRLEENYAQIFGYCTKHDFLYEPDGFGSYNVPTMYQKLNKLKPIYNILDEVKCNGIINTNINQLN